MKLPDLLINFIKWRYSHLVTFSIAGAGLELFMNLFHIGEANIYRSIKKVASDEKAKSAFEEERRVYESVEIDDD